VLEPPETAITATFHPDSIGEMTLEKIRQIRQAIARLPDPA
jgi:hypothetical protein